MKIFYAWQNDLNAKANRYFIKKAIKSAISELNKSFTIKDSPRSKVKLDHDTKDVPGMPNIAEVILMKLDQSDIVIADLSYIASSNIKNRAIPNPNVIFELGYSFKSVGTENIICIMNAYYGAPDKLFFDIVHRRWPITYCLAPNEYDEEELKLLKDKIKNAINIIIKNTSVNNKKTQTKNKQEKPFTQKQDTEFKYIFDLLDLPILFNSSLSKYAIKKGSKLITEHYFISLIDILYYYIHDGINYYWQYKFEEFSKRVIHDNYSNQFDNKNISLYIPPEVKTRLRTSGLTRPTQSDNDPFTSKTYKFIN